MIAAKEEAPSAGAAWGSNRNGTNDGDGVGLSQLKRLATAQARAALRGIALHILEDDRGRALFVVSRDALTRQFDDLASVESWLDCLEAAQGAVGVSAEPGTAE
jgi:hypothetical protein